MSADEGGNDSINKELQIMLRYLMLYNTFCKIKVEADKLPADSQTIQVDESTYEVMSHQNIGSIIDL